MWMQEVLFPSLNYFASTSSHSKCFWSPSALSKVQKVSMQRVWLLTNYQYLNFFCKTNDKLINNQNARDI